MGQGRGIVSLAASPLAATVEYAFETETNGVILLTKTRGNPGADPNRAPLHKFIQVDTSVTEPDIDWEGISLKIHDLDSEAALAGIDDRTLSMYWRLSTVWQPVAGCEVNTESNYVGAAIDRFGVFCVQGDTTFYTCDADGTPTNRFSNGQTVYVTGTGLGYQRSCRFWLQPADVEYGEQLIPCERTESTGVVATTDTSGSLAVIVAMELPFNATGDYMLVADDLYWHTRSDRYDVASDRYVELHVDHYGSVILVR